MKILHINTLDSGGAANACKRLHFGLLELGVDSKVLLKNKRNEWPQSFKFAPEKNPLSFREKVKLKCFRILKELKVLSANPIEKGHEIPFLLKRPSGLEMYSFPYSTLDITQSHLYKEADVINLHWVANFLDYKSFFEKNTKPIIWTFHDMNPFLGIDHYKEEYLGVDNLGNPIIRNISKDELELNDQIKKLKYKFIENVNKLTIVTPSMWLANKAKKSNMFSESEIRIIPYGLDDKVFAPREQKTSREILGIPLNKKIILFVADSVSNKRKGFEYLQKAIKTFESGEYVLCSVGKGDTEIFKNSINLGNVKDERLMSCIYSAADVFIIPSLIDNLPNTVLESLMCGTPVIGFPVGGIPEMISDWENGLLAEDVNVDALQRAILKFFEKQNEFNRNEIREKAVLNYNQNRQASAYISLFAEVIAENRD